MKESDGLDGLLDAKDLARILKLPTKSVYTLPIPRVSLGPRRIRWRLDDLAAFIDRRRREESLEAAG